MLLRVFGGAEQWRLLRIQRQFSLLSAGVDETKPPVLPQFTSKHGIE